MLRSNLCTLAVVAGSMLVATGAQAAVSLTSISYTQDFNTLQAVGVESPAQAGGLLPFGWRFVETGTSADTSYGVSNGSANAGDTYSYGAANSADRALGGLLSGANTPLFGAVFTNNLTAAIQSVAISYTGEQWRRGTSGRADQIDFQYRIGGADSLTAGTWIDFNALDFVSPTSAGTVGLLDGNLAANQSLRNGTINFAANIGVGQTFAIRWSDFNAAGADDGLAVDTFGLTATLAGAGAVPEPATWAMMISGFGLVGGAMRRRTAKLAFA